MRYVVHYLVGESDDAKVPFTAKDDEEAIALAIGSEKEKFAERLAESHPHLAGKPIVVKELRQKPRIGPFDRGRKIYP